VDARITVLPAVVPTSVRASSISIPTPEPLSLADGPGDSASWWAISSIASWLAPGSIAITFCIGIERPLASRPRKPSMRTFAMPARRNWSAM
jgi:hypothetical protein